MTIGRFGGDSVLVKIGSDRLFRAALVLSFIGMAGASLVPNRWVTLAAYMVAGVGISTFFPKLYDDALVGALAATELSVGQASALVTLPTLGGLAAVSYAARLTS